MILTPNPKLRMLAGPNGSGKSTLFNFLRNTHSFPLGYCLNPDEIERELSRFGRLYLGGWGVQLSDPAIASFVRTHGLASRLTAELPKVDGPALVARRGYQAGYFISVLADLLRRQWMAKEESFTFETVMSHPDRVDLLREAVESGYRTYLYYVCTNSPGISGERITNRVKRGGHDVDRQKVRERYDRSLALLPKAIQFSSRAFVFDNSSKQHRLIAEYESGVLVKASRNPPPWFVNAALRPGRRRKNGRT